MGCLALLLASVTPRFVMLFLWIFTDYMSTAFGGWFWPFVGFFVLPTTTLAFAIAENEFTTITGGIEPAGILVIVIGVAIDLGLIGSGRWGWKGRGIAKHPAD
jgi:hypothetical protein